MHYKATKLLYERKKQIIKRVEVLLAEKDNIDIQLDELHKYDDILRDVYDYLRDIKQKFIKRSLHEFINLETDLNLSVSEYQGFIDLVHERYALRYKTITWLRHPSRVDITIDKVVETIVND